MTTNHLSIAIAQIAPVVGDIEGNVQRIRTARASAAADGADLVVFCELVISGYPPEDLVQKPGFQRACREAVETLATETDDGGPAIIIGAPWVNDGSLHNGALLLDAGKIAAARYKVRLPNYGVFDEPRRFTPGPAFPDPIPFRGVQLGLMICEDMWLPGAGEALREAGAEILIVPHGSPFRETAIKERTDAARERATATGLPIIFVNQLAGQDEILFEGASFIMSGGGKILHRAPQFFDGVFHTGWENQNGIWVCTDGPSYDWADGPELTYRAVTMAVRDYVEKNHFKGVVIGLSGGVDSALTAAIAVDALGADRVHCVMMPSRYTS